MAARLHPLLEHVHRLAARLDPEADAVLLERFVRQRDSTAFEALVYRHGAMVLSVCRRVLGNVHDAEDVFQATFLVLARKAADIRPASSLPAWLHGTAHRLALKQRQTQKRRQNREARRARAAETPPPSDPLDQLTAREMLQALDEELQRLPEVNRLPLILCCLEGRTQDEAATMLGWTPDSVRGRLHRGRALLNARLERRGLAFGAGLLAAAAFGPGVKAALPAGLARATVEAAVSLAAGGQAGVAAGVLALAEEAMRMTGLKVWAILLGVSLAVSAGGFLVCQIGAREESRPPQRVEESARPEPEDKAAVRTDRYGDPLPLGALARLGTIRLRHAAGVRSLSFTRDGKGLITAGKGESARLWDIITGRMLRQFGDDQDNRFYATALSPDGRTLAGKMADGVCLWDAGTGTLLRRLQGGPVDDHPAATLAFSPDGKTLASVDITATLHLWDTNTGKELWAVSSQVTHQHQVAALTYSADGKMLIWADYHGRLHLWDAATGKELHQLADEQKQSGFVWALVRSLEGRVLAVYGPAPEAPSGFARLWDVATGREVWHVAGEKGKVLTAAAFSPDGKLLAMSGPRGSICLYDAATGKELRRCAGGIDCQSLAFSPDGKLLASGGGGEGLGSGHQTVHLWDVGSGREVHRADRGHEGTICSVTFAPDGKDIISSSWEGSVRVWDASTAAQRRQLLAVGDEPFVGGTRVSIASALVSDGNNIISAHWERNWMESKAHVQFHLWERNTGRELRGWSRELGKWAPHALIFSANGQTAACDLWRTAPDQVHLWETATDKELSPVAGHYPAFSSDGRLLATAPFLPLDEKMEGKPGSFALWETTTAKELCTVQMPEGRVHRLLFSPDARMLVTASHDAGNQHSAIHLWPLARDESRKSTVRVGPPRLLAEGLRSLRNEDRFPYWFGAWAFSPDGRTLAISGESGTVRLLETADGKERACFPGHAGDVAALAFAPDGRRLASGSRDTTILIWDVTGRLQGERGASAPWLLRPARLPDKELEKLWADLAADDARRAGHALWTLAAAPAQAVPYLRERLRISAANAKAHMARIPQLLRDLDDDAFVVREKARAELMRLGEAAAPALRRALEQPPSLEVRRSLEQILKVLEAKHHVLFGEPLRQVRAVEVLEQIGTPEARAALKALTAGAEVESSLTQEACAALERLHQAERR